jgi:hypothetical protein
MLRPMLRIAPGSRLPNNNSTMPAIMHNSNGPGMPIMAGTGSVMEISPAGKEHSVGKSPVEKQRES